MDLTPFRASVEEIRRERGRAVEELNAAKARVKVAEERIARLDRLATDLDAVMKEAQADGVTAALPMDGLPATAGRPGLAAFGAALAEGIVQQQKRNRERNDLILKVMAGGGRDWTVQALVEEMTARGFATGLTQPHDAIRVALDRMAKRGQGVVKMGPGRYRLRSRLAERDVPVIPMVPPEGIVV